MSYNRIYTWPYIISAPIYCGNLYISLRHYIPPKLELKSLQIQSIYIDKSKSAQITCLCIQVNDNDHIKYFSIHRSVNHHDYICLGSSCMCINDNINDQFIIDYKTNNTFMNFIFLFQRL